MNEIAVLLNRLQFALTVGYHFLFVPLTIGLIMLVVVFEYKHVRTKNEIYKRMGNFWGTLFIINFAIGVPTGLTMEVQFGSNWSEYSKFMGDIFGSPLAIEALLAFFLESTFVGIWIFYRHKLSDRMRLITVFLIALGTHLSAIWIITANGFMQNPVGYELAADGSKVLLTDFSALLTNPYVWFTLVHTMVSAYLLGSFFMMAVSAYKIRRKEQVPFFVKSMKTAVVVAIATSIFMPFFGHQYAQYVAKIQPAKAATFDAVWETDTSVPMYLIVIPIPGEERNIEFFPIPKVGSFMYTGKFDGEVVGLKDFDVEDRPNVPLVHYSFRVMAGLGMLFVFQSIGTYVIIRKKKIEKSSKWNKMLLWSLPLPYVAITAGWIVAEAGRQPWIVNGLMRTEDAISQNVAVSQIIFSMVILTLLYSVLFATCIYLMKKAIRKGPALGPDEIELVQETKQEEPQKEEVKKEETKQEVKQEEPTVKEAE